ncbi:DUF5010 domain-containing protein [Streptomyces sp. NPDC026672]|uniref:DUF5010 domain-containing protein n=1 Tax=Streptomyces sp. NPDC026672 TaxID=3155252 RepID=UPI0033FCB9C9
MAAARGPLGVTFGFSGTTLKGGPYNNQGNAIYNKPMFRPDGNEAHFWDSYVEELNTAGVSFVAPTIRGHIPSNPQNANSAGDTTKLADLVAAIRRSGSGLKVSALDDTAASLTDHKNLDKHGKGGYDPKFDVGDKNGTGEGGYKYIWDYNLRHYFEAVPADMRQTIDGRPVIYEWSLGDAMFTNQGNGNAAAMLRYVKDRAKAEFGVDPFMIVDTAWLNEDPAVADVADGVDSWFNMSQPYTMETFKGKKFAATVPGFHFASGSTNMNIDPDHGNTFKKNLAATVDGGAAITLVEGFTDWEENAAMWRGRNAPYDQTHYDYPGQMLNILRQCGPNPYPAHRTIQGETADSYAKNGAGNGNPVYRDDGLTVVRTEPNNGWAVGSTASGDWVQWNEVALGGTSADITLRMSTDQAGRQVRVVVDGKAGPVTAVPAAGWENYRTVNAGHFTFTQNTVHTVRVEFVNGGLNLDSWSS